MLRNIEIDLINKEDFVEKYNEKKVSKELIEYIIKQAMYIKERDKIKITLNRKFEAKEDCIKMLKEALKEEYNQSLDIRRRNNEKQVCLLILGIAFLFFSRLMDEGVIWKEILLITGWVPIWEVIEVELFPDMEGRQKRRIIKKILESEIVEQTKIEQLQ